MIDERKLAEAIKNRFAEKEMTREAWDVLNEILHIISDARKEENNGKD